jgi:hypothetical protein
MAIERRGVRDEADARACLAAMARSGMTLKAWANANGVDGRSLQAWVMTLERRAERREIAPRFVELVTKPANTARYLVHVRDVSIEVDDHFDDTTLGRLIAVVAAC